MTGRPIEGNLSDMTETTKPLRYPRSFLAMLLAGFAVVAVPLTAALAYSAWDTRRLTEASSSAVVDAAQAARASRSLANRISGIERLARQAAALGADELMEDLAAAHQGFARAADELLQLPLAGAQLQAVKGTVGEERKLHDLLAGPGPAAAQEVVAAQIERLAAQARDMVATSNLVADRQVERLSVAAEALQSRLVLLVSLSTALALAVALVITRLIARPIGEIDASIRQLGGADFARPIRVRGPRDLRHLGGRLDWLRRRLSEAETQKNRFLRHVSHELKSPLTAVREGAELLNDQVGGPLAPQQRQVVSIMRDNSVKLQRMIEELLDYQRMLHAAAALQLGPVPLDALIRETARSHLIAARAKGQRLELALDAATVQCDRAKLRTVVDNLIGNAVKFTPAGGTISVSARERNGEAVIDVIDSGPGIPPEERESVFDLFFRGRAKSSGGVKGSGLGLAIARELVEAHGGRIAVVSEGRGGAHFRVVLPRSGAGILAEAA